MIRRPFGALGFIGPAFPGAHAPGYMPWLLRSPKNEIAEGLRPAPVGAPSPLLGDPSPSLGDPSPSLGDPSPSLGDPSPSRGDPRPRGETLVLAGRPLVLVGDPVKDCEFLFPLQ